MALRNVPFRSEVLAWDPDTLADYFKKVSLDVLGVVGLGRGLKMESGQNMRGVKDSSGTSNSMQPRQLSEHH